MRNLWSLEHKFEIWKNLEILACEYWYKEGKISKKDWHSIENNASFTVNRILEIENTVHHDVIAFLTCMAENIGPSSRFVHFGLTSSDVADTAFSFIINEAGKLILKSYDKYLTIIYNQAVKYKDQIMVGRTHGVHAEPTTLGLKFLGYYQEAKRNYIRLNEAFSECNYGKISGAVGTYSQIPPELEEYVLDKLNLRIEPVSTQVIPRDRHAFLLNVISLAAQGIARFAQEIRLLQKTESREIEEVFQKGQKGSSAMPHKKNPIICERMCGLARVLLGYSISAQQNISLWHERDISHSSAERIIFPDALGLLEYMIIKMTFVVENIAVSTENCIKALNLTRGLLFSSKALLLITESLKLSREEAYLIVQEESMKVWDDLSGLDLRERFEKNKKLKSISSKKWDEVFNAKEFLKNIDIIFERCERK